MGQMGSSNGTKSVVFVSDLSFSTPYPLPSTWEGEGETGSGASFGSPAPVFSPQNQGTRERSYE